ncbi:hypothetical protein N7486_009097 [Penicillium sp. IBT 16267x]|nr:hypothetical protein N7486_009097 [Penicillium sp. IBT 16267x]
MPLAPALEASQQASDTPPAMRTEMPDNGDLAGNLPEVPFACGRYVVDSGRGLAHITPRRK